MEELYAIYLKILTAGLIAIRDAAAAGDPARCKAEAEHLHNLPSLIGEPNKQRHLYYISAEKTAYLKWVLSSKRKDLMEFVSLAYMSYWNRIEQILAVDEILKQDNA
jgi:hypothetical protein